MRIFGTNIPSVFSLVVWGIAWELVGRAELLLLIPPLTDVIHAAFTVFPTNKFQHAVAITLEAFAWGMALAVVVGIPLGTLMGRFKLVDEVLGLWVNVFVSAPLTAVVPVLMAILGFGQTTVITTVFMFAVWVIVLDTRAGIKGVNKSLIEMARSFGASRFEIYRKILLLAALPEILAGIRLGLIRGVKGVVIGQLLIAIIGLGELFELYSRNFLFAEFWALIITVFIFAFAVAEAVGFIEKRIEFYASSR